MAESNIEAHAQAGVLSDLFQIKNRIKHRWVATGIWCCASFMRTRQAFVLLVRYRLVVVLYGLTCTLIRVSGHFALSLDQWGYSFFCKPLHAGIEWWASTRAKTAVIIQVHDKQLHDLKLLVKLACISYQYIQTTGLYLCCYCSWFSAVMEGHIFCLHLILHICHMCTIQIHAGFPWLGLIGNACFLADAQALSCQACPVSCCCLSVSSSSTSII